MLPLSKHLFFHWSIPLICVSQWPLRSSTTGLIYPACWLLLTEARRLCTERFSWNRELLNVDSSTIASYNSVQMRPQVKYGVRSQKVYLGFMSRDVHICTHWLPSPPVTVYRWGHRLNIELDLKSLFGLLCTAVLIGWDPATPPTPRVGPHIRGRFWSAKIDDTFGD